MTSIKRILYLFAIIVLLAMPLYATEYYVKNGGNDAASGLDDDNAWETIAKVNGESFSGDDIIYFKRGDTWREQLTVPDSGTSGHPTTIQAYGEGADPIINGSDLVTTWTAVEGSTDTWTPEAPGSGGDAADYCFRDLMPAATLGNDGYQIQVDAKAHPTANSVFTDVYIGEKAAAGDAWDMEPGTITQITWDTGGTGTTITAGTTKESDWIVYDFDKTKDYIISFGSTGAHIRSNSGTVHYKAGGASEAGTANVTGYTTNASRMYFLLNFNIKIAQANTWQAALTTEPYQVFIDGTLGTRVGSVAAVNSTDEWYWESDVLYIYYTEDPDGAIDVEATIRDGINLNGKDYIDIGNLNIVKANKGVNIDWKDEGRLLEGFENTGDWTPGGAGATIAADAVNHIEGTQSIRLSTENNAVVWMTKSVNWDISDMDAFVISVYFVAGRSYDKMKISFSSTSNFSKCLHTTDMNLADVVPAINGWRTFMFATSALAAAGGATVNDTITYFRVQQGDGGSPAATDMTFDNLRKITTKHQPIVCMTFDDGYKGVIDLAKPILDSNGQEATVFAAKDFIDIGHDSYLDQDDCDTLYAADWDISNHTLTQPNLSGLTKAQIETEIDGCYDWLISSGYTRSAPFMAYPQNDYNALVISVASVNNKLVRCGDVVFNWGDHPDGLNDVIYWVQSLSSTVAATVTSAIDAQIASGGPLFIVWHDVTAGGGNGDLDDDDLQTVSDYIKTKTDASDILCMTVSEYYDYITLVGVLVHDNTISNCCEGIYVGGNAEDPKIYDNVLSANTVGLVGKSIGGNIYGNEITTSLGNGVELRWGGSSLSRNEVHTNTLAGVAVIGDGTQTVDYNLIHDNTDDGVFVTTSGALVYNNVVYDSGVAGFDIDNSCTVRNNIVRNSTGDDINIISGATVTGGYNCFQDAAKAGDGTYTDTGTSTLFSTDPLMTDPSNDDFTLQVGSPCINRGTFVGLLLDYLGLPVPIGHRPDIGAYEHKNGGAVIH